MRFSKLASVLGIVSAAVAALSTSSADATQPRCSFGEGYGAYQMGYTLQSNLLSQMWYGRFGGDCNHLEDFQQAFVPSLPTSSSVVAIACRNEGMNDAIRIESGRLTSQCVRTCANEGEAVANIAADTVCHLAAFRTGRPPTICSVVAEQTCRAALAANVAQRCPEERAMDELAYQRIADTYCNFGASSF